jgi:uncharacterized protein (TIGR02597 family)
MGYNQLESKSYSFMKANKLALFSFGLSLFGAGVTFGQTATTDPVGFISLNIAGGGSVASPKLSLISATLTRPILYQGLITGISGTTITVSSTPAAPWAIGAFNGANGSHYVEIVSTAVPTRSGTMSDITSTPTTSSIVTSGDLSVNQAAIGDTVRIRKDVTIADLFGATNSAGLLASDDPATADEVLIYNGASSVSYYYYIGDPMNAAGWYKADDFAPSAGVPIAPNEAVVVKRKAATPITATSVGSVKTGNTVFAVVNGLNVLGTASAKGLTLDESGLRTGNDATGVSSTDDPATADEVILYGGASPVSYYYYIGDPMNAAGWYKADDFAPSGTVVIAAGTSFVVKRKGGPAFNWALPSPTSF